ncbi:hypothetical protein ACCS54_20530 [Rhizobium johnstonii]|uniref:hypothetical protein n=1 Tax=Rhizobium johnstonii TaxID=3019933 RepID=UPI003F9861BC
MIVDIQNVHGVGLCKRLVAFDDEYVALFPGFNIDAVGEKIELALRATLVGIDAQPAQILVRAMDATARSGSGAKEKLVVKSDQPD